MKNKNLFNKKNKKSLNSTIKKEHHFLIKNIAEEIEAKESNILNEILKVCINKKIYEKIEDTNKRMKSEKLFIKEKNKKVIVNYTIDSNIKDELVKYKEIYNLSISEIVDTFIYYCKNKGYLENAETLAEQV